MSPLKEAVEAVREGADIWDVTMDLVAENYPLEARTQEVLKQTREEILRALDTPEGR